MKRPEKLLSSRPRLGTDAAKTPHTIILYARFLGEFRSETIALPVARIRELKNPAKKQNAISMP